MDELHLQAISNVEIPYSLYHKYATKSDLYIHIKYTMCIETTNQLDIDNS